MGAHRAAAEWARSKFRRIECLISVKCNLNGISRTRFIVVRDVREPSSSSSSKWMGMINWNASDSIRNHRCFKCDLTTIITVLLLCVANDVVAVVGWHFRCSRLSGVSTFYVCQSAKSRRIEIGGDAKAFCCFIGWWMLRERERRYVKIT